MEEKIFKTICDNLEQRIKWCDENIGELKKNEDIKNLPAGKYINLLQQSKTYLSKMDKIYAELNHLLYVNGLLTVQQTSKIISLMKHFCIYRSDLKALAFHSDLFNFPDIPTDANYEFSVLFKGNITIPARCTKGSTILITETTTEIKSETNSSDIVENPPQKPLERKELTFCNRMNERCIEIKFNADSEAYKDFVNTVGIYMANRKKKKTGLCHSSFISQLKKEKAVTIYNMRFVYSPEDNVVSTILVKDGANKTVRELYKFLDSKLPL